MSRNIGKVALCGVLAGLSVAIMLMTYVAPFMTYALPMVAGALILIPSIEYGSPTALMMYVAVAAVSMITVGDKEAALFYLVLFGIYPIIKKYFEKTGKIVLEYILKFVYFNAIILATYYVAVVLLGLPFEDSEVFGKYALPVLMAAGNVAFFVYDLCLTRCVVIYVNRLQPRISKIFNTSR